MSTQTANVQAELDILQRARLMQSDVLFLPLVRAVSSLAGKIVTGLRRRAMRRELMALDDRMLRDIGITRGNIESLVSGSFVNEQRAAYQEAQADAAAVDVFVPVQPQEANTAANQEAQQSGGRLAA